MTQKHEASKCCWKKGADRLAQCRVITNLPFVKKNKQTLVFVKFNEVNCNKKKDTCTSNRSIGQTVLEGLSTDS